MGQRTLIPRAFRALVFCLSTLLALPSFGELAVIVNPGSGVDQLSRKQVINIFLGNHREFPNGLRAKPVDSPISSEKEMFYRILVNKDPNQLAAYWSRLVFAGNTSPPAQVDDVQEVIRAVENSRNVIGYVDRKHIDTARIKVVLTLP